MLSKRILKITKILHTKSILASDYNALCYVAGDFFHLFHAFHEQKGYGISIQSSVQRANLIQIEFVIEISTSQTCVRFIWPMSLRVRIQKISMEQKNKMNY